jgi:hypothetical protein
MPRLFPMYASDETCPAHHHPETVCIQCSFQSIPFGIVSQIGVVCARQNRAREVPSSDKHLVRVCMRIKWPMWLPVFMCWSCAFCVEWLDPCGGRVRVSVRRVIMTTHRLSVVRTPALHVFRTRNIWTSALVTYAGPERAAPLPSDAFIGRCISLYTCRGPWSLLRY